eukprot:scaffold651_cov174-Ochromonas_danica.AAC.9
MDLCYGKAGRAVLKKGGRGNTTTNHHVNHQDTVYTAYIAVELVRDPLIGLKNTCLIAHCSWLLLVRQDESKGQFIDCGWEINWQSILAVIESHRKVPSRSFSFGRDHEVLVVDRVFLPLPAVSAILIPELHSIILDGYQCQWMAGLASLQYMLHSLLAAMNQYTH